MPVKKFMFFETIFSFLQLNLVYPLKASFKILYCASDSFIILMTFGFLSVFIVAALEDHMSKILNQKYMIYLCRVFKKIKQFFHILFQFFKSYLTKMLESGNNPVTLKIIKFVFIVASILMFFDLLQLDFRLCVGILLFWLVLIINLDPIYFGI